METATQILVGAMDLISLCNTDALQNSTAKEFTLSQFTPPLEIFVARKNNEFYAYFNRCPHTGVNLNWRENEFFDIFHEFLQCATHGALFKVEDGYCVRGPCAGAYLQAVRVINKHGTLFLQIPYSQPPASQNAHF